MTNEIIRMAREVVGDYSQQDYWPFFTEELERFAALVAAHEREACAKVCDGLSGRSYEFDMGRLHSAAIIRTRGQQ